MVRLSVRAQVVCFGQCVYVRDQFVYLRGQAVYVRGSSVYGNYGPNYYDGISTRLAIHGGATIIDGAVMRGGDAVDGCRIITSYLRNEPLTSHRVHAAPALAIIRPHHIYALIPANQTNDATIANAAPIRNKNMKCSTSFVKKIPQYT